MDIIKNPVTIGLFAGTLTYVYLTYNLEEKIKKTKERTDA
jgi:hypothetical protein